MVLRRSLVSQAKEADHSTIGLQYFLIGTGAEE